MSQGTANSIMILSSNLSPRFQFVDIQMLVGCRFKGTLTARRAMPMLLVPFLSLCDLICYFLVLESKCAQPRKLNSLLTEQCKNL